MPRSKKPDPQVPFIDAESAGDHRRPKIFVDGQDVQMALEAGFTQDEVDFMLDRPEEPSPTANVDGEDLGPLGADQVRRID